jgi:hypothetical protein
MNIQIYTVIVLTNIICNYTFVNVLLAGALISSNILDILHHIGACFCKRGNFLAHDFGICSNM